MEKLNAKSHNAYIEDVRYIEDCWQSNSKNADVKRLVKILKLIDSGKISVVGLNGNDIIVNQWVKKTILLFFRNAESKTMSGGYYDKVPLKTESWTAEDFRKNNIRIVPGAIVRFSAHIAEGVVVMPSFINVGANIRKNTMIDTHTTVGSCAYIGEKCHISDGVTIGGVLEPLQANPVIIMDNCFVGARSTITEGVIVETGAVLSSGVTLTQSTPIIDKETGSVSYGRIPGYSVVIPGTRKIKENLYGQCAIIVKKVDQQTRAKTSINELLR